MASQATRLRCYIFGAINAQGIFNRLGFHPIALGFCWNTSVYADISRLSYIITGLDVSHLFQKQMFVHVYKQPSLGLAKCLNLIACVLIQMPAEKICGLSMNLYVMIYCNYLLLYRIMWIWFNFHWIKTMCWHVFNV